MSIDEASKLKFDETFTIFKFTACCHGSKDEEDLWTKLSTAMDQLETHLAHFGTDYFGGRAPGSDDAKYGNSFYYYKLMIGYMKNVDLFQNHPLINAWVERWNTDFGLVSRCSDTEEFGYHLMVEYVKTLNHAFGMKMPDAGGAVQFLTDNDLQNIDATPITSAAEEKDKSPKG